MAVGNMPRLLHLETATSRVVISPDLGGGVVSFEAITELGLKPVLRPVQTSNPNLFDIALNLLVPFSNRISGGGFSFDEKFYHLEANLENEPFPIHGDGFQKPWSVVSSDQTHVKLQLTNGAFGPFRYSAKVIYELIDACLTTTLTVTNNGEKLPFGGGFHPWFPRYSDTKVQFVADTVWLEDSRHLPMDEIAIQRKGPWDYSKARTLPSKLINNAFTNWQGLANIFQPSLGIKMQVAAQQPLSTAIMYSPNSGSDFFCFEPVSHIVDAHNQPTQPSLKILVNGETIAFSTTIAWSWDTPT